MHSWHCSYWRSPANAEDITGPARVIDGDTIEVAGERIRLHGIDAPENKQTCKWPGKTIPCGQLATTALMDLTAGAQITCKTREKDRYGRWVAVCYDPDGFDISRNMVHTGWALAYRRYSLDYVETGIENPDALQVGPGDFLRGGLALAIAFSKSLESIGFKRILLERCHYFLHHSVIFAESAS